MRVRSALLALLLAVVFAGGCERQGPAEEMGEELDEAGEEVGDAAEEACDEAVEDC